MRRVFEEWESQVELRRERARRRDRINGHADDAGMKRGELAEFLLQLDQLLLTRSSTRAFVEVDHNRRAAHLR